MFRGKRPTALGEGRGGGGVTASCMSGERGVPVSPVRSILLIFQTTTHKCKIHVLSVICSQISASWAL